jgi:murein DD-endopeptidase MepM/ murein hydrolase activator NlpD
MAQDTKYGLSVIIKHDYQYNGQFIQTGYAHLSKINVSVGMTINRGDIIGYTGTWGTGPHLHFTLRIGDQKVNPTILFPYK